MATATVRTPRAHRVGAQRVAVSGIVPAAMLLGAVAAVHVAIVPSQTESWPLAGLFFGVLGTVQAVLAATLARRGDARSLLAALWTTVGAIVLYVWSRTTGLPFRPVAATHADHAGHASAASQAGHAVGGHGNGVPIFPSTAPPSKALPVGPLDIGVLLAELVVIGIIVFALPARHRAWTSNALVACGVALLVLRALLPD